MAGFEDGWKGWIRYVVVPLIGGGGIIAILIAVFSEKDPPPPPKKESKIVVLLDSINERYDGSKYGQTNNDSLAKIIDDYSNVKKIFKESVSPDWDRHVWLKELNPELILIHWSAFTGPNGGEPKFRLLLGSLKGTKSCLVVYTRHNFLRPSGRSALSYQEEYEKLYPHLKGKIRIQQLESRPILDIENKVRITEAIGDSI